MTRIVHSFWIAWLLTTFPAAARAEPTRDDSEPRAQPTGGDHLFPAPLRLGATAATGSPYVAIGEVALGFGPHAALGFVAGVTPRVAGLGVHPRFAFPIAGDVRAIGRVPVLYYPELGATARF
jgi:hypothetical protein